MSSTGRCGRTRTLRVLIAHNRYHEVGGEERHVELLERGLAEAGVDVLRFERDSGELDGSVIRKAVAGLVLTYRPGAGGIRQVLREWRPSVVHFHNIWPLLTPSALRAAKRSGAAVVLTAHNYRFACPGGALLRDGLLHEDCIEGSSLLCGLRNPRESRFESLAYGLALEIQRRLGMLRRWVDAFVAPSEFMARMLVRSGLPRDRVHVIPHGLPRSSRSTATRATIRPVPRASRRRKGCANAPLGLAPRAWNSNGSCRRRAARFGSTGGRWRHAVRRQAGSQRHHADAPPGGLHRHPKRVV